MSTAKYIYLLYFSRLLQAVSTRKQEDINNRHEIHKFRICAIQVFHCGQYLSHPAGRVHLQCSAVLPGLRAIVHGYWNTFLYLHKLTQTCQQCNGDTFVDINVVVVVSVIRVTPIVIIVIIIFIFIIIVKSK